MTVAAVVQASVQTKHARNLQNHCIKIIGVDDVIQCFLYKILVSSFCSTCSLQLFTSCRMPTTNLLTCPGYCNEFDLLRLTSPRKKRSYASRDALAFFAFLSKLFDHTFLGGLQKSFTLCVLYGHVTQKQRNGYPSQSSLWAIFWPDTSIRGKQTVFVHVRRLRSCQARKLFLGPQNLFKYLHCFAK